MFLGRFAEPKRQDLLIAAFARLPQALQAKVEVRLLGNGPKIKAQYTNTSTACRKSIYITETLDRAKALAELSEGDILVLVSDWEGFPMVILEALQLSIPVIANNVGGMSEAIDATVGALLPAQVTSEDIALALIELISNDDFRHQKGIKAKERGMQYTGEIMSREVFALYVSILKSYARKV